MELRLFTSSSKLVWKKPASEIPPNPPFAKGGLGGISGIGRGSKQKLFFWLRLCRAVASVVLF